MEQLASPTVLSTPVESHQGSASWATSLKIAAWLYLIAMATYLSFGIGVLALVTGGLLILKIYRTKVVDWSPKLRGFFAKLVITGVAYQFMGFVLISGNHIVNDRQFFEPAGVDYKRIKLVDAMNLRKAVTEVDLNENQFEKLMVFYREQAQASIDTPDEYGIPEGFTYFELAPTSVDTTLFEQIGHKYEELKPLLVGYEQNDGWGNEKRGTFVSMDKESIIKDIEEIIEAFPEIDHGAYGPCRVFVWDSGHGSHRFFIWFPKHRRGFLKSQAAYG